MFGVQPDGEKTATLVAKKFLTVAQGSPLVHRDVVAKLPDDVWQVLLEQKAEFRYVLPTDRNEVRPWRISWVA